VNCGRRCPICNGYCLYRTLGLPGALQEPEEQSLQANSPHCKLRASRRSVPTLITLHCRVRGARRLLAALGRRPSWAMAQGALLRAPVLLGDM